jgi:hypothetical protein
MASKFVEDRDIFSVNPMDEAEASSLVETKLGIPEDRNDVLTLVKALEFIPLAIVQAAAYIRRRAPRCSISQYLEIFQRSDHKTARLLSHEAGHHQRDPEAKNSILITWQLSFDHIRASRPSAADLLSLMSFFDPQGIHEDLLHDVKSRKDAYDSDEDSITDSDSDMEFEDDILTLREYSLISTRQEANIFEMHRLVQLSARMWLETSGNIEHWKEQFIANLHSQFPSAAYENWGKCESLYPHVRSAVSQRPISEKSQREWASLLNNGWPMD